MSLKIVAKSQDNTFTLESDLGNEKQGFQAAHAELTNAEAKKWLLKEASNFGVVGPTLGLSHGAPYPVNAQGETLDDLGNIKGDIVAYRIDLKVNAAA